MKRGLRCGTTITDVNNLTLLVTALSHDRRVNCSIQSVLPVSSPREFAILAVGIIRADARRYHDVVGDRERVITETFSSVSYRLDVPAGFESGPRNGALNPNFIAVS